jgi:hypothetical protein
VVKAAGSTLLLYLFRGGRAPDCLKAANANDHGTVGIPDAIFELSFLFLHGPVIPAPFNQDRLTHS